MKVDNTFSQWASWCLTWKKIETCNVFEAMKHPGEVGESHKIEVLDAIVSKVLEEQVPSLPLEKVLVIYKDKVEYGADSKIEEALALFEDSPSYSIKASPDLEELRKIMCTNKRVKHLKLSQSNFQYT